MPDLFQPVFPPHLRLFLKCPFVFQAQVYGLSDLEVRNTLKTILTPEGYPSIQIQALRRELARRLMQEALEKQEEADELEEFKSTLSRLRNSPDKRNLEALARGGYIRTQPPEDGDDSKRNLYGVDLSDLQIEEKRGIQSLARNGELKHHRENHDLMDDLYDKRNIENLAGNYNYPAADTYADWSPYPVYKRNIASLAREGLRVSGRRDADKRNIGSIKAQYKPTRNKRQIDYYDAASDEYPSPVFQNQNVYDYEELMKELTGSYPNTEKRFLGE